VSARFHSSSSGGLPTPFKTFVSSPTTRRILVESISVTLRTLDRFMIHCEIVVVSGQSAQCFVKIIDITYELQSCFNLKLWLTTSQCAERYHAGTGRPEQDRDIRVCKFRTHSLAKRIIERPGNIHRLQHSSIVQNISPYAGLLHAVPPQFPTDHSKHVSRQPQRHQRLLTSITTYRNPK
jgi:hypothetical protein